MKQFCVTYTFLNTQCEFKTADLFNFIKKLDWIEETPEILRETIIVSTEVKIN